MNLFVPFLTDWQAKIFRAILNDFFGEKNTIMKFLFMGIENKQTENQTTTKKVILKK